MLQTITADDLFIETGTFADWLYNNSADILAISEHRVAYAITIHLWLVDE